MSGKVTIDVKDLSNPEEYLDALEKVVKPLSWRVDVCLQAEPEPGGFQLNVRSDRGNEVLRAPDGRALPPILVAEVLKDWIKTHSEEPPKPKERFGGYSA